MHKHMGWRVNNEKHMGCCVSFNSYKDYVTENEEANKYQYAAHIILKHAMNQYTTNSKYKESIQIC